MLGQGLLWDFCAIRRVDDGAAATEPNRNERSVGGNWTAAFQIGDLRLRCKIDYNR